MLIEYESSSNKFLIKCEAWENQLVMGLPDRRFRKSTRVWAAPVLFRNVVYMLKHMNNPSMYSKDALNAFNDERRKMANIIDDNKLMDIIDGHKSPMVSKFPSHFEFKKEKPMAHQMSGLEKFYPLSMCAIFYEQGLGKTYTSINLCAAWRLTNQIDSMVVVCPSSIKLVWTEELKKYCPLDHDVHVITSGKTKKTEEYLETTSDFQILIVGVEAFSQGGASDLVKRFMSCRRSAMVIDESSRIKTHDATRTEKIIKIGTLAKKRIILSGTAITQGIEDLYSQFKFLSPRILGYDSFYSFRAQYCLTVSMCVGHDNYGREITTQKIVGYQNENELLSLIKPYTQRVEKKDALDLPEKIYTNRMIEMNPTQRKLYSDMKEELIVECADGINEYEVTTVLEKILRLQQITGGHYPHDDGENVIAKPIPGKNPKIEELSSIIDEISGKIIVWCQFRSEIALVAEMLTKNGIPFVEFHGGKTDDEKRDSVTRFRNQNHIKVFLATRAAAYGLTLIEASTAVYFSQGYSLEEYEQSQDRIHRIGQDKGCSYIHLVCDKTVDTLVISALRNKKNLATMMYEMLKGES